MPTSVSQPEGKTDFITQFVSLHNTSDPGNHIGYRFFEHTPIVHGHVPQSGMQPQTAQADSLEKEFASLPGIVLRRFEVTDKAWVPQTWTFYIAPADDGFDMLWIVTTGDAGLNDYYAAQQCFRMSGTTNDEWRKNIAEAPAFSEFDLWAAQESQRKPRTTLSYVRRDNSWQPLPPIDQHVACRTPLGTAMDSARSDGDLTKITALEPYGPTLFEPRVDSGLVTRTDLDGTWVCALYWENTTHVTNHHPADCLHSVVNLGPLPPNGKRALRGRIYWMEASKDELLSQWRKEFPQRV